MRDETQLIQAVLTGDTDAFGDLVTKYQNRLFNTMFHVAGSREEAEDIVQEAFVQAFVKLDSFQGASGFYTWLYRIAFNLSISRRRRRRPESSVGAEPKDNRDQPPQRMMRKEDVKLVQQALAVLSEQHRTVLVLREIEGNCYETIADILDLPIGTVRSRLYRARLQLRDELKKSILESE